MFRSLVGLAVTAVLLTAAPVAAQGRPESNSAAQPDAVAQALTVQKPKTSGSVKALYATYGVLQGLDMYSTAAARRNGAREANPMMNTGFAQAGALKTVMTAATVIAVKNLEKKNKKAAVVTLIAINATTALVVANNMKNAARTR